MSAVFTPQRRKLSADQFERMGETGILGPEARVELIEGEMIEMPPIGSRHAAAVDFLSMHFARVVGDAAVVRTQNPLRLSDDSDHAAVRRKVGGLPPHLSIFELGFAGKGRIYFTQGRQRRFRVLSVGAKNTQKTDLEYLSRLPRE